MKLGQAIRSDSALRYLTDGLQFQSSATRTVLLAREMMTSAAEIEISHERSAAFIGRDTSALRSALGPLKNVSLTIDRLRGGVVLGDVEFFELKELAAVTRAVKVETAFAPLFPLPDLAFVAELLDPDRTGVPSFYVYDSYDAELASLRRRYASTGDQETLQRSIELENEVRKRLSARLQPAAEKLESALDQLFRIDIALAVAIQTVAEKAVLPSISSDRTTRFKGLVNAEVRDALRSRGGEFQPIEISLSECPTVIVGSNMGGKSVTLRSLVAAQRAFQFGLAVTAEEAEMEIMDDIVSVADSVASDGLSAFGTEITLIDSALRTVARGGRAMVLVDEPARTTNPVEGAALTEAFVELCRSPKARVVVATHYNLTDVQCRRLRVKGYADGRMDYRLEQTSAENVPHEALAVAERLGVSADWIENAKKRIEKNATK